MRRIQKEMVSNIWTVGKESNMKYIRDMEKKYGIKKIKVTEYEGVKVGDECLEENVETEVRIYGSIEISENAKEVLKLPPKFATFRKLRIEEIQTEVEKGMAKFRMQIRNEGESATDENEPTEELVDTKSKAIDLTNLRVTELPFCKRIYIPDQVDTKMEVKIQSLKDKFVDKAKEYINNKTDDGKIKEDNLSKNQRKGIREINQKIKENCVVFKTDKIGQLSIDGKENYRECIEEHIKKDEKVTIKDYEKTEKVLNAHATALSRILGLGTDYGHEGRVTEAVVVLNSHPPDLYGLRKDHKEEKGSLKDSEVVREEIGGAMNPANCLENETDKVGGRVGLENNQKSQLGFQTGGINNPVNSQNKQINSDGGEDDLANSLSESRTRAEIKKKDQNLGQL